MLRGGAAGPAADGGDLEKRVPSRCGEEEREGGNWVWASQVVRVVVRKIRCWDGGGGSSSDRLEKRVLRMW